MRLQSSPLAAAGLIALVLGVGPTGATGMSEEDLEIVRETLHALGAPERR